MAVAAVTAGCYRDAVVVVAEGGSAGGGRTVALAAGVDVLGIGGEEGGVVPYRGRVATAVKYATVAVYRGTGACGVARYKSAAAAKRCPDVLRQVAPDRSCGAVCVVAGARYL